MLSNFLVKALRSKSRLIYPERADFIETKAAEIRLITY
jgi:hypothetical protein